MSLDEQEDVMATEKKAEASKTMRDPEASHEEKSKAASDLSSGGKSGAKGKGK